MSALQPLWRIEQELEALIDSIDVCPPELEQELATRIAEYVSAEVDKVDKVSAVLTSLEGVAANAKAEIDRLHQRQQSAEKAAARLKGYVLHVLRQRDGRPLKGRNVTFSVRRSEQLVIIDPTVIPDQWKRTTVTVDYPRDPLKRAIKAGEDIPGVTIQYGEHLVRK